MWRQNDILPSETSRDSPLILLHSITKQQLEHVHNHTSIVRYDPKQPYSGTKSRPKLVSLPLIANLQAWHDAMELKVGRK